MLGSNGFVLYANNVENYTLQNVEYQLREIFAIPRI